MVNSQSNILFNKTALSLSKDTSKQQTHLSLIGGKYNIIDSKLSQFYREYYNALKNNQELFLVEKITNRVFNMFFDIDVPIDDKELLQLIDSAIEIINELYENDLILDECLTEYTVLKREQKYHIIFYNLKVNHYIANHIVSLLNTNVIDTSVYRTGLRMLGSKKSHNDNSVYQLYDLNNSEYIPKSNLNYTNFLRTLIFCSSKTSIIPTLDSKLNNTNHTNNINSKNTVTNNKKNVITRPTIEINNNLQKLLYELSEYPEFKQYNYKFEIDSVRSKQNREGFFCYYITIKDRFCPFKEREHMRDSSYLYLELTTERIYLKCLDSECRGRKYPEQGVELPKGFMNRYPTLYYSIATKYWTPNIEVSSYIKRVLEESIENGGTHYRIAKAAFEIYKDKFRVDSVKNSQWYKFDGIRFNKTYSLNLLISEELPKYYESIKIRDTSLNTKNLEDYLVNESVQNNSMRNSIVDKIILNLETVTFKDKLMNQLTLMFKDYDPNFYDNLDNNPHLLGFNNGVYDLKKHEFREGRIDDYITLSTGCDFMDYDPSQQGVKQTYDLISKIIPNSKVMEFILLNLGRGLSGVPDEKFFIFSGFRGANGKSTFMKLLSLATGDYFASANVSMITQKRAHSANANPDMILLKGRRFAEFQEPEADDTIKSGLVKQISGGDRVSARELYKSQIQFYLQITMILICNIAPRFDIQDGGNERRQILHEFDSRFCHNPNPKIKNEFKIDPNIREKMHQLAPYFLSILIHYFKVQDKHGIKIPKEIEITTKRYQNNSDKFNEFFDECIAEHPTNFEKTKVLYQTFSYWWGLNYPKARFPEVKDFKRSLTLRFGTEKEHNHHLGFYVSITEPELETQPQQNFIIQTEPLTESPTIKSDLDLKVKVEDVEINEDVQDI